VRDSSPSHALPCIGTLKRGMLAIAVFVAPDPNIDSGKELIREWRQVAIDAFQKSIKIGTVCCSLL